MVLFHRKKANFETKNIHFEKSHNAENCKGWSLRVFGIQVVAKYQKT